MRIVSGITGLIGIMICLSVATAGCYYDKEELLYPDSACDTTIVTYSTGIVPILSANCNGCHGGNFPSAGIKLDTYAGVQPFATNGRILGAVSHAQGFSPMPKNATKLSACNLSKITKWIAAGAPNN